MEEKTRSAAFSLTAVLNGNTYYSSLVLEQNSKSLMQFYNKATGTITPSWEGSGPKFRMDVYDNEGVRHIPSSSTVVLCYNGVELDASKFDGTSKMDTVFNSFKRTVDPDTDVVTFQIMKDLFGETNMDNDEIYIKGTIVITGNNTQQVQTPSTAITLVQTASGGSQYYAVLECGAIMPNSESTVCYLKLYNTSDGSEITSQAGVAYKFYYADLDEYKDCEGTVGFAVSGNTLTVSNVAVTSSETIKGSCIYQGETYSDYGIVVDYNDPIVVGTFITGTNGGSNIVKGETATIGIKLYKAGSDGELQDVTNQYTYSAKWTVLKSDGSTPIASVSVVSETISLSYDQIIDAGGTVTGFVSLESLTKI